jgi:hypothetical protein
LAHYLNKNFIKRNKFIQNQMKQIKRFSVAAALLILGFNASAQDTQSDNHTITVVVPNVALLDLETAATRNFTSTFTQPSPNEAGEKLTAPANNTGLWLNYSSIISTTVTSRKVGVKLSALVPGVDVAVVAGAASTGAGTRGTPTSAVTLTTADQDLITGIGSAYTATGSSNGHNLTYSFTALDANYANLRAASPVVTVTYTLIDN